MFSKKGNWLVGILAAGLMGGAVAVPQTCAQSTQANKQAEAWKRQQAIARAQAWQHYQWHMQMAKRVAPPSPRSIAQQPNQNPRLAPYYWYIPEFRPDPRRSPFQQRMDYYNHADALQAWYRAQLRFN